VRRGALALVVGLAAGLSGVGAGVAAADPTPLLPASAGHIVTLITGDQVVVRDDGNDTLLRARGSTGSIDGYQTGDGRRYLVPVSATPYLSRELDPSLFDPAALTASGPTGRVPLRLSFAPGSTPTPPPGITFTSVDGDTASGYTTPASGPAFAAALRSTIGADVGAGKPAGSTPLVAGLMNISLAGAASAGVASPDFPLHILQINTADLPGHPADAGWTFIANTANVHTFASGVPLANGTGKVAVPAGDYTLITEFDNFDASGNVAVRHTVVSDVTVPSTGNVSTTVEENAATAQVGVSTPTPAVAKYMATHYQRQDPAGNTAGVNQLDYTVPAAYISPTPAATVGKLGYSVEWAGEPVDAGQHYRYDVAFGSTNGIPAQEHDTVTENQVATVHDRFSVDPAGKNLTDGELHTGNITSSGGWIIGGPTVMPGDLTDYLASDLGNGWQQQDFTRSGLELDGDGQVYLPGHQYTVDWAHGPMAARLGQHVGAQTCQACQAGGQLTLGFNPISDSDPTHSGELLLNPTLAHFTLYRNGVKIFDQNGVTGAEPANQPTTPGTYRAVYDQSLAGATGISQSTVTHTDVSVPYHPDGDVLPSPSTCMGQSASTPCVILPALDLNYQLATDQDNTSTAPLQQLDLRVGHVSYDGAGSHAPITSASVQVSYDGGATWQPVSTTGHAGNYLASWPNKPGTSPSIKVTATDADGGSITQTVVNAYTSN
jgi:hypothetical protein